MAIHRSHLTGAAIVLVFGAVDLACASHSEPAKTAASPAPQAAASAPASGAAATQGRGGAHGEEGQGKGDTELVVSRDVVARCPTLQLVRAHASEFDPDMVWLAVLESIADCMSERGPMSDQNLGVSGDEEHRHVVREVLGSRGVAPTRVVAKAASTQGAAECQGGLECDQRVEITIVAP